MSFKGALSAVLLMGVFSATAISGSRVLASKSQSDETLRHDNMRMTQILASVISQSGEVISCRGRAVRENVVVLESRILGQATSSIGQLNEVTVPADAVIACGRGDSRDSIILAAARNDDVYLERVTISIDANSIVDQSQTRNAGSDPLNRLAFQVEEMCRLIRTSKSLCVAGIETDAKAERAIIVFDIEQHNVIQVDANTGIYHLLSTSPRLAGQKCMEKTSSAEHGDALIFYPSSARARNDCVRYVHARSQYLLVFTDGPDIGPFDLQEVIPMELVEKNPRWYLQGISIEIDGG